MNGIVQSWQRSLSRPRKQGTDAITFEDTKILIGDRTMPDGVIKTLPKKHFDQVIRYIKQSSLDKVKILRSETHAALKRVGKKRSLIKAVKGVPDGSDQSDIRSLFVWMAGVAKTDKGAVTQIVAIDATAYSRTEG